jgi:hypothetical protein
MLGLKSVMAGKSCALADIHITDKHRALTPSMNTLWEKHLKNVNERVTFIFIIAASAS